MSMLESCCAQQPELLRQKRKSCWNDQPMLLLNELHGMQH